MNHKDETKAVKGFLQTQGFKASKVGHGRGTAWGWLEIRLDVSRPTACLCTLNALGQGRCAACSNKWQDLNNRLLKGIMSLTGRSGQYDGDIMLDIQLA